MEKVMRKVRARYRPIGGSPFELRGPGTVKIDGEAPDDMTMAELKKHARAKTPKGFKFIEVVYLKD